MCSFFSLETFAQNCPKEDNRGVISVSGTAVENYPPDNLVITLSVETIENTAQKAVSENSIKAESVINKLKNLINQNAGDTIKTSYYSVQPYYEYSESRKKSQLVGYKAINQVTVKTKNIKNAGLIIDGAVNSGANNVQGINFVLDKNEDYCNSVMSKAAAKAKEQANVIAKSLGVKIAGIKSVSTSCGVPNYPRPMYFAKEMMAAGSAITDTPIESGNIEVNATVNVEFYIQ